MFLGLRTVIYHTNDIKKAKEWYTALLGKKPYFDQPFYVGFNVGGFELGLDPDMTGVSPTGSHEVAYWGVAHANESFKKLLELGATQHSPVQEVGEGIRVAIVKDPFGNTVGIIENPHFSIDEAR
ncbi:MAG: VOC family protein [Ignavibacteria bacterium]|nr:VOC family protein [Ignavibacteria bacterium]MBI3766549.1 VOC family protein [Ignavibacteriales bacterium]